MSPTRPQQPSLIHSALALTLARAGDRDGADCGPRSRLGHVVPAARRGPVQSSVSGASPRAARVPAIGCIVGTHAAERSSPALRVAARVLSDQGLTAPQAGA